MSAAPGGRTGRDAEPDEQERALVQRWQERIDRVLKDSADMHKAFEERRRRVRGVKAAGAVSNDERTNLIYATLAAILPQVYAKNPDISVTPSEAAGQERYGAIKGFCATLQSVLSRMFVRDAHLKERAKACTRAAMTTSVGWAKLTYQRDIRQDPIILGRMNDVQDNILRLQALIANVEDADRAASAEADRAQLELSLQSLETQVEKIVSEGLVIDAVLSEDIIILDQTVRSFDGYRRASAIAHRVWYTEERFAAMFGRKPDGATAYSSTNGETGGNRAGHANLYAVFEIWSLDDTTVLTLARGEKRWARAPFQPEKLGAHWYPFFPLGFNLVDGQFQPMSDVELLEKLSDEYNANRTQLADHREDSRPVRVVRTGGSLTPEDVERIQRRRTGEVVAITGAGGKPLRDDMEEFPGVTLNPAVYDTGPIRSDIDVVSGATDALRGTVQTAKTATEAEYLQAGLAGRTGERQDTITDWIGDMAQYATEILLQELTPEQVQRIAGAEAQWPQLAKDDVLDLVEVSIRAGTTGRPNKMREQEQWTKLLPMLQAGIEKVAQYRMQGLEDVAQALTELLRETVRRFDERIDIDKLIPPTPAVAAAMPALPNNMPAAMPAVPGAEQAGLPTTQAMH